MTAPANQGDKLPLLVVEDDPAFATTLLALLESQGYAVEVAHSSAEALERLAQRSFPIVVSDIYLDQRTGLDILRRARAVEPRCAVILITGKGSLDTVLEATREGAFDYLAKPFPLDRLARTVANAAVAWRESGGDETAETDPDASALVGNSPAMVEVYKFISRVADADSTVLLQGETGTGKERVARMIHERGARRKNRFVVVDCGALPAALLEAELFGALRGAYTGADRDRTGLFESADGGTVFLDEIGEMELGFQQRLLRFLQEREVRPLGGTTARKVDVRVIAASNRDLRQMVAEKKFREDLWYRLQVACLTLAPLRERRQDIPLLIGHFLAAQRRRLGKTLRLSDASMNAALQYSWPGNVRQLQNLIERLAILNPGPVVEEAAFAEALAALDPGPAARAARQDRTNESLSGIEEEHIRRVLEATRGNKTRAAEILGIERKTLYRKLERMKGESF
ncbi:MAG TPA: sigma-54 dependent transcriptional regulator [Terriglobia bacterium]|nr:sigma-54 dependent transcriptional regulator [Terriglobia bacterium]